MAIQYSDVLLPVHRIGQQRDHPSHPWTVLAQLFAKPEAPETLLAQVN
jgi:hypothetical protein